MQGLDGGRAPQTLEGMWNPAFVQRLLVKPLPGWDLEHFHQARSAVRGVNGRRVFLALDFIQAQSQGFANLRLSPWLRPSPKILVVQRHIFSVHALNRMGRIIFVPAGRTTAGYPALRVG